MTFNGIAHPPTYVSASQLIISVTDVDLALAGTYPVVVTNPAAGGGSSASVSFSVNNLAPSVVSLTPSTVPEASPDTQVQITGTNFLPSTTVSANSALVASTYVSATQLVATIPSGDLATAGMVSISVTNPAPGGGNSSPFSIVISDSLEELLPRDESVPVDPESISYFTGLYGVPPTSSASSTSELGTQSLVKQEFSVSQTTTAPGWICKMGGPTSAGGICIPGVPLIPQMPPGSDASETANCGVASYLMVRDFYRPDYAGASAPEQIVSILNLTQPGSAGPEAPAVQLYDYNCDVDANDMCVTSNSPVDPDAAKACVYRAPSSAPSASAWYGPVCGFGFDQLKAIAMADVFPSSQNVSAYSNSNVTLDDLRAVLCPAYGQASANCGDRTQTHPVIVHVQYLMRYMATSSACNLAGLPGVSSCCLQDGLPATGPVGAPGAPSHCVGHYMVLVGIDGDDTTDPNGFVYVNDPLGSSGAVAYQQYSKQDFLNSWSSVKSTGGAEQYVVINGAPPVSIVANSTNLSSAQVDAGFSATVSAQFGNPPYQFTATNLPPGLVISTTGVISGIPTTSGTFQSTLQVTDSTPSFATAPVTIVVGANPLALTITAPGNLDTVKVDSPLTSPLQLTAAGGVSPYHWSANGITCPNSIPELDGICVSDGGIIQGTPLNPTNGPVSFSLQVTDSSVTPQKATQTESLAVLPANLPPQMYSVTASPSTVSELNSSTLACTAADPQQLSLSYSLESYGRNSVGDRSECELDCAFVSRRIYCDLHSYIERRLIGDRLDRDSS